MRCVGTCKKRSSGLVPTSSILISFHELFHKNKGQLGFNTNIGGFIFYFDTFIGDKRKTAGKNFKGKAGTAAAGQKSEERQAMGLKQQNPGALIPEKSINDKKYGVVNARWAGRRTGPDRPPSWYPANGP